MPGILFFLFRWDGLSPPGIPRVFSAFGPTFVCRRMQVAPVLPCLVSLRITFGRLDHF
jgi:hypothetical protein